MRRQIPGQRYFDQRFLRGIGLGVREHWRKPRTLLVSVAAVTLYLLAGGSTLALVAVGIVLVVGLVTSIDEKPAPNRPDDASRAMSDVELSARHDDERAIADGELVFTYERALMALRALRGDDVSVVIAGADGEPTATLDGRLHGPVNISQDDVEVLSYTVGATGKAGACFYVSRRLFLDGRASVERGDVDGALRLDLGDSVVWVLERCHAER